MNPRADIIGTVLEVVEGSGVATVHGRGDERLESDRRMPTITRITIASSVKNNTGGSLELKQETERRQMRKQERELDVIEVLRMVRRRLRNVCPNGGVKKRR